MESIFADLVRKAGSANVWQCTDETLVNYAPIMKDIDPLAIQIGKFTNKLVAFTDEGIARQEVAESDVEGHLYPDGFARMFFYAMTGASPWDATKSVWHGVVPQMINVATGVWSGILWSTSPFGLLYFPTSAAQSVVPLFPELMTGKPSDWEATAVITPLDARLGYSFKAEGHTLRPFEWVLDDSNLSLAGSGSITILNQRGADPNTFDVELKGEKFYSKHNLWPYVTFEKVIRVAPHTTIPINKVVVCDGTRTAYVTVDGVRGHITLGLPPSLFAGDRPIVFENSEKCAGKVVRIKPKADITDRDIVFRCGELLDEGMFLYLQMVNRALMGTGKLPSRMTFQEVQQKVISRVVDGIDRSGHVDLAASLPPLQRNVFLASIMLNEIRAYDARGIYHWSRLPVGRWHTLDDYQNAVEFGLNQWNAPRRGAAFRVFEGFFENLRNFSSAEVGFCQDPSWSLLECAHKALESMEH
jgi:hypothetical protein